MATNIKDKIAKLLALADSPNENEAKAALLKARQLMAEHKLRPEECQKTENIRVIREKVGVTVTKMTNPWAVNLSAVIAEHYCCKAFRTTYAWRKIAEIGMVGLEDDFEIAKRIFLYAYDCVTSACKSKITKDPHDPPGTYRERCNAYGWGFVMGVKEAFKNQEAEHQEWGLVMVVPQAVEDAMADMGKPSEYGSIRDGHSGYKAMGYQDGENFDPSSRLSTSQKPSALGGVKV